MYWTIFEVGDFAHGMVQTSDPKKVVAKLRRGIQELKVHDPQGTVVGRRFKERGRWNWFFDDGSNQ